jgi:hypothetical protein
MTALEALSNLIIEPILKEEATELIDPVREALEKVSGLEFPEGSTWVYKPKYPVNTAVDTCIYTANSIELQRDIDYMFAKDLLIIIGKHEFPLEIAYQAGMSTVVNPYITPYTGGTTIINIPNISPTPTVPAWTPGSWTPSSWNPKVSTYYCNVPADQITYTTTNSVPMGNMGVTGSTNTTIYYQDLNNYRASKNGTTGTSIDH